MRGSDSDLEELRTLQNTEDPRTVEEMKAADSWQEGTVKEATRHEDGSWTVKWSETQECRDGGVIVPSNYSGTFGAGCPARGWLTIKPGDTIRFYGHGFGSTFHGIDVNGREVFYRTLWERFAERVKRLANYDREYRERIVSERKQVDEWLKQLTGPYRARIERFRRENATFDMDGGTYETYPVLMAQRVEQWVRQQHPRKQMDRDTAIASVKELERKPYEEQAEILHAGEKDNYGVSGNQVGAAFGMAAAVLCGNQI